MSEVPIPFSPSPSDHLNAAPQTRKYRKDRSIRALGMQGITTGGPGRPLYGLGQMTEEVIMAARGSKRPTNTIEQQVDNRPKMAAGEDGSVSLLRQNAPATQVKHKESGTGWPSSPPIPSEPAGFTRNVGDWGPSVTA